MTATSVSTGDRLAGLTRARRSSASHPTRPAYLYLATASVLSAFYFVLHGQGREIVYEVVSASSVAAIAIGTLRFRPQPSLPWWLLAGGMTMWFIGDVLWSWYPYFTGRDLVIPSAADVSYLLGYPLLLVSIGMIVRTRRPALRRSGWIDSAIVAVVFALMVWQVALQEAVANGVTMGEAVNIVYPLADTILVGFLARLLFAPGHRTPAYASVVTAICLVLVADIAYAYVVATDSWGIYDALNAGWLAGYVLLGAAALHPSMVTIAEAPERMEQPLSRRRTLVLAIVASLPVAQMIFGSWLGLPDSRVATAIGMVLVLGMVFYRLSSLIGSIERQTAELTGLHHDRGLVLDEITRAIEDERMRLAAELHDGPIQRVTSLGMRAYMGMRKLRSGDQGAAAKILEEIEEDLGREVQGLRALMTQLRPPVLSERGLVDALRDHADAISSERGIGVMVEGQIVGRLNAEVETGLYRIAQEALMNACRHSGAQRIDVRVEPAGGRIRLMVHDNGVGFDTRTKLGHDGGMHFGLLAMRERAAMLHGSLTIASVRGQGTTLVADVPLEEEP